MGRPKSSVPSQQEITTSWIVGMFKAMFGVSTSDHNECGSSGKKSRQIRGKVNLFGHYKISEQRQLEVIYSRDENVGYFKLYKSAALKRCTETAIGNVIWQMTTLLPSL